MFRAYLVRILFGSTICLTIYSSIYPSMSYGHAAHSRLGLNLTTQQSLYTTKKDANYQRIIFFRHGEKPPNGIGQLTCRGLNRALALIHMLDIKYGQPDFIFAPNPVVLYEPLPVHYVRPLATIEPFAINFNHSVNTQYNFRQVEELVNELLSSRYHSSLTFVVWEHLKLVKIVKNIVKTLHGDPDTIPAWMHNDYDSIYIVDIDWLNKRVHFTREAENLNNQKTVCQLIRHPTDDLRRSEQKILQTYNEPETNLTQTILFVPEAETYSATIHHLSCQGLHRALALQKVLTKENRNIEKDIDMFISANTEISDSDKLLNNSSTYNHTAGIMTIEPTAISQVKPIYCPYEAKEIDKMKNLLLSTVNYSQNSVIVLPTNYLLNLATKVYQTLGGNEKDIPKDRFDINTIHKLQIIRNSDGEVNKLTLSSFPENIYPSAECNF